jgi:hypothetical protein
MLLLAAVAMAAAPTAAPAPAAAWSTAAAFALLFMMLNHYQKLTEIDTSVRQIRY